MYMYYKICISVTEIKDSIVLLWSLEYPTHWGDYFICSRFVSCLPDLIFVLSKNVTGGLTNIVQVTTTANSWKVAEIKVL